MGHVTREPEPELLLIGGRRQPSSDGGLIDVVDPATGEVFAQVSRGTAVDVDQAVVAARSALGSPEWTGLAPAARGRLLADLAGRIRADEPQLAAVESQDTGKPLSQARADVAGAARFFEYYAGLADKLLGESIPLDGDRIDFTVREPIGVSAHIIPWNYPLQMLSRGVAPALCAGCTVVVKPAAEAPLSSLRLGQLAAEAGFPDGVLNVVPGDGPGTGAALAGHPGVDQVTFTGSVAAGVRVAQLAAAHVAPVVLELGGKSPHLVFPDADLPLVAQTVVRAAFANAGQTCTAGSRLLVHQEVAEPLVEMIEDRVGRLRLGPGATDPDIGPLISARQLSRVSAYVDQARAGGARVRCGGTRPTEPELAAGFYFAPTIVDRVRPGQPIAQEEVFGPVLAVLAFETEAQAVQLADDTEYGLTAGVWTRDIDRAMRVARSLHCGQVTVNTWGAGAVETPFGGYRNSGFGREKSLEGLRSYLQVKNICVKIASAR